MTGGQASIQGYLVQTLITLLQMLGGGKAWEHVVLEPSLDSEKVDTLWTYLDGSTLAVQIKSSKTPFTFDKVKKWAAELEGSGAASEYELRLVGSVSRRIAKTEALGRVLIPPPIALDLSALEERCMSRLADFLESLGLPPEYGSQWRTVVRALLTYLQTSSVSRMQISRTKLSEILMTSFKPKGSCSSAQQHPQRPPLLQHWPHGTPANDTYVRPEDAYAWLNDRATSLGSGLISMVAIPGAGKTSLASDLLRTSSRLNERVSAAFAWRFDVNSSVDAFLDSLLQFARHRRMLQRSIGSDQPEDEIVQLMNTHPLVLVLDGLQVHQHAPCSLKPWPRSDDKDDLLREVMHGRGPSTRTGCLQDPRLRRIVNAACTSQSLTLLISTSWFPVVDAYHSLGIRHWEIAGNSLSLSRDEGSRLLGTLGLRSWSSEDRCAASVAWEGHPLGLRLVAGSAKDTDSYAEFCARIRELHPEPAASPALAESLDMIFGGFERSLTSVQRLVLGTVALFPTAVSSGAIQVLLRSKFIRAPHAVELPEPKLHAESLRLQRLGVLCVFHDRCGNPSYLLHGALRPHFRRCLLEFLSAPDSPLLDRIIRGVRADLSDEVVAELVVASIVELADRGLLKLSDELLRVELGDGRYFLHSPSYDVGIQCLIALVGSKSRSREFLGQLTADRFIHCCRLLGLLFLLRGDLIQARRYHAIVGEFAVAEGTFEAVLNQALSCCLLGRLDEGRRVSETAIELATEVQDRESERHALCTLAFANSLSGRFGSANSVFRQAMSIGVGDGTETVDLHGTDAILWADHLIRAERPSEAKRVARKEIVRQRNDTVRPLQGDTSGFAALMLARAHLLDGRAHAALRRARCAELQFLGQGGVLGLVFVHNTIAAAYCDLGRFNEADDHCDASQDLAGDRLMVLCTAEASLTSARIALSSALSIGQDDSLAFEARLLHATHPGEAAMTLARQYGFDWLLRRALDLLAEVEDLSGYQEAAVAHRNEATALLQRSSDV